MLLDEWCILLQQATYRSYTYIVVQDGHVYVLWEHNAIHVLSTCSRVFQGIIFV